MERLWSFYIIAENRRFDDFLFAFLFFHLVVELGILNVESVFIFHAALLAVQICNAVRILVLRWFQVVLRLMLRVVVYVVDSIASATTFFAKGV
jgi:hypothetical protein